MHQASTDNKALLHAETLFLKNVSLACKLQKIFCRRKLFLKKFRNIFLLLGKKICFNLQMLCVNANE